MKKTNHFVITNDHILTCFTGFSSNATNVEKVHMDWNDLMLYAQKVAKVIVKDSVTNALIKSELNPIGV